MASDISQQGRIGELTTPLGEDTLALGRFDGRESISELFEFRIEAISAEANIDFKAALGLGATVKLKTADAQDRYFNGILSEARWAGRRETLYAYQLVLRPWLWLLTLTSDCRIFSQQSPPQIIKQVFTDRGFSDFRDALQSSYPTLEYCVQYRETDFAFVSRLMEQYGIYYFFEYSDGKHMLVLADMKSSCKPADGLSSVSFLPVGEGGRREKQHLEEWARGREVESGSFKLNEYDYTKPNANMLVSSDKPGGYAHDSMEMYDYIGEYVDVGVGNTLATVEAEAAQSLDDRRTGAGSALSLYPGALVTLTQHPVEAENQEYLVVACSHFFDAQRYRSGAGGALESYLGNFELTPSSRPLRAQLRTKRPRIAGVQSAKVVPDQGNGGAEIDVDELGRVLVEFYWDRKKKLSRRVRVAQFWAGNQRGALFLPRIGDEVMIAYEEGDPDRPLVVGSVYNGTNTVPLTLPSKMTKSGILTQSSKGGGGYHMLLFDDTAGSESVKLRSQKDLMVKALNNETRVIGVDQSETIGGNVTKKVSGNETVNIGGSYSLTATQSITLTVGASSITITPSSITLQSPNITLNADATVSINAPATMISG